VYRPLSAKVGWFVGELVCRFAGLLVGWHAARERAATAKAQMILMCMKLSMFYGAKIVI
jgi:hypothetical protein